MPKLIVLDFDGTLTNAEEEGKNYRQGYLQDVALLANLESAEVFQLAQEFENEIMQNADRYGWNFHGKIVAPAIVDPYLRIMPISRMIFDKAGVFTDIEQRDRILDRILYKYNYQKTVTAFREGAGAFLQALGQLEEEQHLFSCVVTNSHTDPVQNKIRLLSQQRQEEGLASLDWMVERVHGSAKKYIIDEDFSAVSAEMSVPNLSRPIFLRRHLYYQRLCSLQQQYGVDWNNTVVIGDIFELDLSLPLACGAQVALMVNQFTPQYEIDFLQNHARGMVFESLSAAQTWVENLTTP